MVSLLKNKKAQSLVEYALLISTIAAAMVFMQTFIQRSVQGRLKQIEDELNEPVIVQ
jgi:Flp pilus assembly pilin Flp